MRAHRLKTYLWVQIQQRYCERNCLPIYIVQKGENNAGAIIMKINIMDGRCRVFSQISASNGHLAWQSWTANKEPVLEKEADEYISKQMEFDPDIWVIEIEDTRGLFEPIGEII